MNPKTIFITCFFNLVVRNILETDFFRILRSRPDLRLILLVPAGKADFYRQEFGGGNILIEEVPVRPISKVNLLFHWLSWNLLKTRSKKIHKLVQLEKDRNFLRYWLLSFAAWLGGFRSIQRIFRAFDYRLVPGGGLDDLFEKYKPDAVFATDIQDLRVQELSDTYLIREARRKGIPSAAIGRSWDSITTKGLLRTLPDLLILQNNQIKEWAVKYHGVPAEKIAVVGVPHYDNYLNGRRTPREDFFMRLGLDQRRKLVFVTPPSDIWTGDKSLNIYLLNVLAELGEQIVVRFPIFGGMDLSGFVRPANMIFDIPKNESRLEETMLRRSDDDHLADLIYHSDVVVTSPSSIVLDAAIFGKPVVLIGLDGPKTKSLWSSLRRYYEYEHQQAVIKQGFLKVAKTNEDLLNQIRFALENPTKFAPGFKVIAENACYKLDGQSGRRLAETIIGLIPNF